MHAILELINYFGIVINCIIICSPHISALVIWTPLPQGIGEGREGEGTFAWWVWKPMKFLDTRGKNIEQSSLGTQLNKPKFITMWSANKSNLLIPLVGWESESVHSPHLPRKHKLVNMSQLSLLFPAMTRVGVGMGEEGETDLNKTNKYFSFIHHHDLKYPSTATISAVFLIFSMHLSHPQGKPCPWFFSGRVSGGCTIHRQDFPWHRLPALLYWVVGGVGQGWNWIGASIFARKQYKSRYLVSKSKVSYVTRLIQTV